MQTNQTQGFTRSLDPSQPQGSAEPLDQTDEIHILKKLIVEILKAIIDIFIFIIEMLWFMGQTCYPKFNKLTNKKFRKCFQKIQYNK